MHTRFSGRSDSEAAGIYDDMPPLEEDEECAEDLDLVKGNVFVTMRSLSINTVHDEEVQRSNIFHTKCQINNKVCLMIIDSRSCTNVVSTLLIEKLGLPTTKHPHHTDYNGFLIEAK